MIKASGSITLTRVDDGTNGIGVSKVEAFYYLSTSNTTQTGGSWVTTSPAWVDGKYIWQKTKTTLTNGTATESAPICVTGGKGGTGATGKGVSSISAEYYLSTSKTTQTGGSWVTTSPVWSIGKYVWTRSKITYSDSTVGYTSALCDSSWEAINDIEIGGRNLALKTVLQKKDLRNCDYDVSPIGFKQDATYTVSFYAKANKAGTYSVYVNDDSGQSRIAITFNKINLTTEYQFFVLSAKANKTITGDLDKVRIRIYGSLVDDLASVYNLMLESGNKNQMWTPAPEDISNEIDDSETRITETYKALIDVTKKEIDLSVESITTKVNNTEEQVSGLQNQLEITNEVTSFIKTTTESLKTIVDGKADITTIEEWARFNGSSLELGASNSPFKAILSNTELAFWQGNTKVAWISNNELHIANSVIMEILKVGNWQCRDEGGAGLTWRRV